MPVMHPQRGVTIRPDSQSNGRRRNRKTLRSAEGALRLVIAAAGLGIPVTFGILEVSSQIQNCRDGKPETSFVTSGTRAESLTNPKSPDAKQSLKLIIEPEINVITAQDKLGPIAKVLVEPGKSVTLDADLTGCWGKTRYLERIKVTRENGGRYRIDHWPSRINRPEPQNPTTQEQRGQLENFKGRVYETKRLNRERF